MEVYVLKSNMVLDLKKFVKVHSAFCRLILVVNAQDIAQQTDLVLIQHLG